MSRMTETGALVVIGFHDFVDIRRFKYWTFVSSRDSDEQRYACRSTFAER